MQIHHWGEAEDVAFGDAEVLSEGSGPELTVWSAGRADTTIAEAAERVERFIEASDDIDAVLVSLGQDSEDEDVAASLEQLVGEITDEVPILLVIAPPGLYEPEVSDALLAWAQEHDDRVSVIDLRESAPEDASAEEWAAALATALTDP